ncbi:MAG: EF-Tu/IF-2/RF-3 family GTPase [Nitrososphaerales archaeon]
MNGNLIGVFGSNAALKSEFLSSIGKKSETEGIIVYQRNEAGKKFSFLDDATFPERIQGYARIAAISDRAYYVFPTDGKLSPSDGEIAILLDSLGLNGVIQVVDGSKSAVSEMVGKSFKGLNLSSYEIEERSSKSSVIDLSRIESKKDYPKDHTLVYVDRAFSVKGVGVVVLGFVLNGKVSVHDKLRILPSESNKLAEVKGIQISDEDYDTTERGIRVGLSLKGVELKDLSKVSWMDDGSFKLSSTLEFSFKQCPYYKQPTVDRDLHLEATGELLVTRIAQGKTPDSRVAKVQDAIPCWEGMNVCVIDLNSKALRVAGGGNIRA